MFKNIFLFLCLIIFTLVSIFILNIIFTLGIIIFSELSFINSIIFIFLPILLNLYLFFIFIKALIKKELKIGYLFSFLGFFLILFLFYFFYFSKTDYEYVEESLFQTNLYNTEVADNENALIKIDNFTKNNKKFFDEISDIEKSYKNYSSLIKEDNFEKKEEINKKYFDFIKNNLEKLEKINFGIKDISQTKFLKFDYKTEKFPSFQGLSSLTRFSLFQEIYYLNDKQEEKALELIVDYLKFGDKIILGDSSLIGMIVGNSIYSISLDNLKYIISNYNINKNSNNYKEIIEILQSKYDSKSIVFNSFKSEYQVNKYSFEKIFKSSILINSDDLFNRERNLWLNIIEGKKLKSPNYFKRDYIYSKIFFRDYNNFGRYIDSIDDLNTKKINILNILSNQNISCTNDNECETPFEYLVLSSCPFSSKCIDNKCRVVCQMLNLKESKNINCTNDNECNCDFFTGGKYNFECKCIGGNCMSIVN